MTVPARIWWPHLKTSLLIILENLMNKQAPKITEVKVVKSAPWVDRKKNFQGMLGCNTPYRKSRGQRIIQMSEESVNLTHA